MWEDKIIIVHFGDILKIITVTWQAGLQNTPAIVDGFVSSWTYAKNLIHKIPSVPT